MTSFTGTAPPTAAWQILPQPARSAGHHIANNGIFTHVVGLDDTEREGKFKMNLLGEYNSGDDAFEIERLLEEVGVSLI
jgi:nitrogenase molybdenum-iron protein alpha chain